MRPRVLVLCLTTLVITACNTASPETTSIPTEATSVIPTAPISMGETATADRGSHPATITPTAAVETPIVVPTGTRSTGGVVQLERVSLLIPMGVTQGAQSEMVPAVTDTNNAPGLATAPEHQKITLTGYQLQDTFHEPQILVYPADEYAKLNPVAAEQIQKLKAVLSGSPLSRENMPVLPFFNAVQQTAAKMTVLDFQNGRGIRFLTQYHQYPAQINNHDLFYHFQGLTEDGKYYLIAILPVSSSILAEQGDSTSVPSGGVAFPQQTAPAPSYYEQVTAALDAMYEDSFNPSLFQLDGLIQSIKVEP